MGNPVNNDRGQICRQSRGFLQVKYYREPRRPIFLLNASIRAFIYKGWLADGRSKCHATLNFPTSSPLSSPRPRLASRLRVRVRSHTNFFSIHRPFFFLRRTGSPRRGEVFLAASSLFMGSTPRARHGRSRTHVRPGTRITREGRRLRVWWTGVWTVGILGGIFIVPSCRCRLNNLRVIANSAVRSAVL